MKIMDKAEKASYVETLIGKRCGSRAHDEKHRNSWRKHYMRYDYVRLDPEHVIELPRQSVQSEFWYDDEYDSPLTEDQDQRKAYFMAENMRSFRDFDISRWMECRRDLEERGCCLGWYISEPFVAIWPSGQCTPRFLGNEQDIQFDEKCGMERRVMTEEERDELIAIMDAQRERFRKRLETYWKRYSHKVCAHGYWANR